MTDGGVEWWDVVRYGKPGPEYAVGISLYNNLNLKTLEVLVEKGYADLDEVQNDSPTLGEMLELMRKHPGLKAEGYTVTEERDDFRITVTGLTFDGEVSTQLRDDFATLFANADEYVSEPNKLKAWYD